MFDLGPGIMIGAVIRGPVSGVRRVRTVAEFYEAFGTNDPPEKRTRRQRRWHRLTETSEWTDLGGES